MLYNECQNDILGLMKKVGFFKYHGLGNDFLVIDLISRGSRGIDFNRLAEKMCSRTTGVGADGILVLTGSRIADCCIDLFNSDGSWAEKSGNGLRIVAAYYYSHYDRKKKMVFEINEERASARMMKAASFMREPLPRSHHTIIFWRTR